MLYLVDAVENAGLLRVVDIGRFSALEQQQQQRYQLYHKDISQGTAETLLKYLVACETLPWLGRSC
jgi:hypothetical protein